MKGGTLGQAHGLLHDRTPLTFFPCGGEQKPRSPRGRTRLTPPSLVVTRKGLGNAGVHRAAGLHRTMTPAGFP